MFKNFAKTLKNILPFTKIYTNYTNNTILYVEPKNLMICLHVLKQHQVYRFTIMSVISCIDYPEKLKRFELVYTMLSIDYPFVLNVSIAVSEFETVLSSSILFKSAVWLEREIWDMFGVYFKHNHDLRRILTDYGFPYHPLRKTFPLMGFTEIYYNFLHKKIYYTSLTVSQLKNVKKINSVWSNLKVL